MIDSEGAREKDKGGENRKFGEVGESCDFK